jgi:bacterioferritin
MKGAKDVIAVLNDVLTAELTAVNQYFLHAELSRKWGYEGRYHTVRKQSIDEMKHAEELLERVLLLGGMPNVQRLGKIRVGETEAEQLDADLAREQAAVARLNQGIATCGKARDQGSAELLEKILGSEEEHVGWLEAQRELIKQVGEANYLAQQIARSS